MSDAVWKELTEVSLALGHADEAVRCAERITDARLRATVEGYLHRRRGGDPAGAEAPADQRVHAPAAAQRRRPTPTPEEPFDPTDEEPRLGEHLADAVQFLFVQHMPVVGLLTTLAFPLVIGLGGFLTAGTSMLGLAAISALPGLGVIALVCAMGRRILLEASRGAVDPPGFPDVRTLVTDAWRWCATALLVIGVFSAPAVVLALLGTSILHVATVAAVGALLAPMAFVLAQLEGIKTALAPDVLFRAVLRGGLSYLGLTATCWALFLPFALVAWYVAGQPIWVQIAALGPTVVLPVFVAARLCGTWIDVKLHRLEPIVGDRNPVARGPAPKVRGVVPDAGSAPAVQRVRRPAAARSVRPTPEQPPRVSRPTTGARPAARPAAGARPAMERPAPARPAETRPSAPRPVHAIEGRGPQRQQRQQPPQRQQQQQQQPPQQEQQQPPQPPSSDLPDLANLPGARVFTGRDRITSGAASRPQ